MTQQIVNSVKSADLDVIALTDPERLQFLVKSVADQINTARMGASPPKRAVDLAEHIADIIIETAAQGASLLEVHIIDPAWSLLQRDAAGVSFIDVDEAGYLWPPIEVNFPPGASDSTWRLCQCRPSTDISQPNLILTFEDKIVSELREHAGPVMSNPNETRAEFIRRLVKMASRNPLVKGDVGIRFIPLLPTSVFAAADLAADETAVPSSAKQPDAPPARKNPNKTSGGGSGHGGTAGLNNAGKSVTAAANSTVDVIIGDVFKAPWVPPPGEVAPTPPGAPHR